MSYLLAVKDSGYYDDWIKERVCPIKFESLIQSPKNNSKLETIVEVMKKQDDNINTIITVQSTETIVNSLLVNFSMISHLRSQDTKKIGLTGVDANSNFRKLRERKLPGVIEQLRHISSCSVFLQRLVRSTPPETTGKPKHVLESEPIITARYINMTGG